MRLITASEFFRWYDELPMAAENRRFDLAIQEFDAAHREDPTILVDDQEVPWSLLYHRRMTHWVKHLAPDAPEPLLLAARCQHIRRWTIPRSDYPNGPVRVQTVAQETGPVPC